jgi:VIT1/CCC1 family predicted Fe2+/Mn2+ transporter
MLRDLPHVFAAASRGRDAFWIGDASGTVLALLTTKLRASTMYHTVSRLLLDVAPRRRRPAGPDARKARPSLHIEPRGLSAFARHYIRDLVYGANDGVITTFAVVGGVAGGALPHTAVLVIGAANLAADGISMGAGNLLAIRANERAREADNLPEEEAYPWKHGLATLVAFVVAGAIPLLPFVLPFAAIDRPFWSTILTFAALFGLGAARAPITLERWWKTGLETLALGALVAAGAYGAGAVIASMMR